MKKLRTLFLGITLLLVAAASFAQEPRETYRTSSITHIMTRSNGQILIKWTDDPVRNRCGNPNNWAAIPRTADPALKALALSLYLYGLSARVDTYGCDGPFEKVANIYSPSG